MNTSNLYRGFRHRAEIISHVVWLYCRFSLSYRDSSWPAGASSHPTRRSISGHGSLVRRTRVHRDGDNRSAVHLDEVVLTGRHHYLWRAVDQDGNALDALVQSRRNRQAAKRFLRKLLKGLRSVPRVLITDKLNSYRAAKAQIMPGIEHRQHKGLNNRAELSHQPMRSPERQRRRFNSPGHAQRFLSAHGPINNPFRCLRNRLPAARYRTVRHQACSLWKEVAGVSAIQ